MDTTRASFMSLRCAVKCCRGGKSAVGSVMLRGHRSAFASFPHGSQLNAAAFGLLHYSFYGQVALLLHPFLVGGLSLASILCVWCVELACSRHVVQISCRFSDFLSPTVKSPAIGVNGAAEVPVICVSPRINNNSRLKLNLKTEGKTCEIRRPCREPYNICLIYMNNKT